MLRDSRDERNSVLARLAGRRVGLAAHDLVRVHDKAAVLALAGAGLKLQRLLERHPNRRGVTLVEGRRPRVRTMFRYFIIMFCSLT